MGASVQEALWLRQFEEELFKKKTEPIEIFCDNRGAADLAFNEAYHQRTKHIQVRHHFVRETIVNRQICLKTIDTNNMVADIFTKALSSSKNAKFSKLMGIF